MDGVRRVEPFPSSGRFATLIDMKPQADAQPSHIEAFDHSAGESRPCRPARLPHGIDGFRRNAASAGRGR